MGCLSICGTFLAYSFLERVSTSRATGTIRVQYRGFCRISLGTSYGGTVVAMEMIREASDITTRPKGCFWPRDSVHYFSSLRDRHLQCDRPFRGSCHPAGKGQTSGLRSRPLHSTMNPDGAGGRAHPGPNEKYCSTLGR